MITAFPLAWPDGWPRVEVRASSPYRVTTDTAMNALQFELGRMAASGVIVSSNVPLRRDGTMYRGDHADAPLTDPGVAVYWDDALGNPRVIACDVWRTPRENLRAVGLAIEGLRLIDRTGASHLLERAYQGFARLPAPPDPWELLGVPRTVTRQALSARLRELARKHHPDHGGDPQTMARINAAFCEVLRTID